MQSCCPQRAVCLFLYVTDPARCNFQAVTQRSLEPAGLHVSLPHTSPWYHVVCMGLALDTASVSIAHAAAAWLWRNLAPHMCRASTALSSTQLCTRAQRRHCLSEIDCETAVMKNFDAITDVQRHCA